MKCRGLSCTWQAAESPTDLGRTDSSRAWGPLVPTTTAAPKVRQGLTREAWARPSILKWACHAPRHGCAWVDQRCGSPRCLSAPGPGQGSRRVAPATGCQREGGCSPRPARHPALTHEPPAHLSWGEAPPASRETKIPIRLVFLAKSLSQYDILPNRACAGF